MRLGPYRRFVILVEAVLMVTSVAAAGELAAQPKTPVPDADAQQTATKAAGELFAERFKQAKTTAEKTALATDMMDAASKVQGGSPDQYVLLKIAADIAAGAGDAATALQAVEKMAERFDVSGPKLTAETLLAAAGNVSTTSQHKAVGESVLKIADAVAGAEEYKLALDLCESARSSAQKARQYSLAKELAAKIEDIQKLQRAFQEYKAAWALMQEDPAEPAANLTAGRYLCLVKGDWLKGVPMLALGSDAALKNVSLMELRGAKSAEQQAAIGDAWWDAAETRQGEERNLLRLRAGLWYRQAEPKLAGGLAGIKIKQRLAEIEKLGREIPTAANEITTSSEPTAPSKPVKPRGTDPRSQLLAGAVLLMTFELDTFTSQDGKLRVADLSGCGNDGIVVGATQMPAGRAGAALAFGGRAFVEFPALRDRLAKDLKEFSLACWVLQADREGNSPIFNVGTGGGRSITLYRNNARFRFVLPDGVKHGSATEVADVNCWYHLVGVWNGSAVGIYSNGRLVASQPTVGLTLNASSLSAEPARIGALPGAGDPSVVDFRGLIDELAIFDRALSEQEVQTLCQLGMRGEPLVKTGRRPSAR